MELLPAFLERNIWWETWNQGLITGGKIAGTGTSVTGQEVTWIFIM
jgi:hypothetical protein